MTLESLTVFCKSFFAQRTFRSRNTEDLSYWLCNKPNPYFLISDGRVEHVGSGLLPILKALTVRLYANRAGGFVHQKQFVQLNGCCGWWIKTSRREILD